MSRMSEAQRRAVELLAGEQGWVRRGTVQQKTMDVLVRLDMVEVKRDTAIHVTMYRATQNARDWVRGQQDDVVSETGKLSDTIEVGTRVTIDPDYAPEYADDPTTLSGTVVHLGDRDGDPISVEHAPGCAPLAYLPSALTAIGTDKPWDDELINGTEALLSVLASMTDSDLCDAAKLAAHPVPVVACDECGVSPHDLMCTVEPWEAYRRQRDAESAYPAEVPA